MSERYYDRKAKELYKLKMGSMIDEEYMTNFLEFLRYVPYLKDEKSKVQIFDSGLSLAFRDQSEYDEPLSLEEFIRKLKHFYEHSKHKTKSQQGWKGKDNATHKWQPNRTRLQVAGEKENVAPYKKFNGPQPGEQQNKGDGKGWLQCWTCGKYHLN